MRMLVANFGMIPYMGKNKNHWKLGVVANHQPEITCGCLLCDTILRGEYKSVLPPIFGGEWVPVSSNRLVYISSVRKSLVASCVCVCVCVCVKFEHNLIARNKCLCLQCDIGFGGEQWLWFGHWFRNTPPQKKNQKSGKISEQNQIFILIFSTLLKELNYRVDFAKE